jgi:hypothetical protein
MEDLGALVHATLGTVLLCSTFTTAGGQNPDDLIPTSNSSSVNATSSWTDDGNELPLPVDLHHPIQAASLGR